MNFKEYRDKKEILKPVAKDFVRQLTKKDLAIEEAEIVSDLLQKIIKPDVQDRRLSDFI